MTLRTKTLTAVAALTLSAAAWAQETTVTVVPETATPAEAADAVAGAATDAAAAVSDTAAAAGEAGDDARIAALTQMEKSPLVAAPLLAIKALLCTLYYEQPDAAREIGADDACDANASIPPGHTPRRLPLLTAVTPSPAAPTHGANS